MHHPVRTLLPYTLNVKQKTEIFLVSNNFAKLGAYVFQVA